MGLRAVAENLTTEEASALAAQLKASGVVSDVRGAADAVPSRYR